MYVELARQHHWTPEQVDEMDPDFLKELMARIGAEVDAQKGPVVLKKGKRPGAAGEAVAIDEEEGE